MRRWSSSKNGNPFTTIPSRNRIPARRTVCQANSARVAPRASRASNANTIDAPTTNTKVGNTRSVGVSPFHAAWFIKPHEPGPPLLFTMIMKAMVMPRSTSSESSRCTGVGAMSGLVMAVRSSINADCRVAHTLRARSLLRQGRPQSLCPFRPHRCYTPLQRIPARPLALPWRLTLSDVQPPVFQPFVSPSENRPEFTFRAILLGSLFGIIFGAVTVYVGLRAGLTVAASIPIAVLSISILRAFGRASILENNIVQTTGNAGQSIASGVIFTLPALVFLGFDLESSRIFALALFGGWLGVLFMIPLRRQLIVEEHGTLTYPEGTACADVLIAGERGGSLASRVFLGLGLGGFYTLFQNSSLFGLWPDEPKRDFDIGQQHLLKGGSIRSDCTPEYLGVGYIIGARVAAIMFAGGIFSWLVLMPAIYFFGSHLSGPLNPGTIPVSQMSPSDLWRAYVRPMGAGAVACSGLITLIRTLPTIVSALTQGFKKGAAKAGSAVRSRIEHDLPPSVVIGGSLVLIVLMLLFLQFKPVPGAYVGPLANLVAALMIVVFGFLFVTVSARIVGIVGSSASPVSGMTIATLMATAAIFLVKGWTAPAFGALAITVGGVVCIAASNAGDTSQDLKTGYLVGSTPWKQQVALIFGVMVCIFSIGATLNAMNRAYEQFQRMPAPMPLSLTQLPDGVQSQGAFTRDRIELTTQSDSQNKQELTGASHYILLNAIGSNIDRKSTRLNSSHLGI